MSTILYYGLAARKMALEEAGKLGRLMTDPFGDNGLKIDEAREIVSILQSGSLGGLKGTLVVGPMDRVPPKSSDVLLKTLEEFDDSIVQPILWAYDLNGVSPTIRSRCVSIFVSEIPEEDQELENSARYLVEASLKKEYYKIPFAVRKYNKKEFDLLEMIVKVLSENIQKEPELSLWSRVRQVMSHHNPTDTEIIAALVG